MILKYYKFFNNNTIIIQVTVIQKNGVKMPFVFLLQGIQRQRGIWTKNCEHKTKD